MALGSTSKNNGRSTAETDTNATSTTVAVQDRGWRISFAENTISIDIGFPYGALHRGIHVLKWSLKGAIWTSYPTINEKYILDFPIPLLPKKSKKQLNRV